MAINRLTIEQILELREQETEATDLEIAKRLNFDIVELDKFELETKEAIQSQIEGGTTRIMNIAEKLNLPAQYVLYLSGEYGLETTLGEEDNSAVKTREKLLAFLEAKRGDKREKGKARIKQVTSRTIAKAISKEGDEPSIELLGVDQGYPEIDNLVFSGLTLTEIAKKLKRPDFRKKQVRAYLKTSRQYELWEDYYREKTGLPLIDRQVKEKTISTNRFENPERDLKIDKLIAQGGATVEELRIAGGWDSLQSVRNYLRKRKIYKNWQTSRNKPKLEEQQRKNLLRGIIESTLPYLYEKADKIERKVFEFSRTFKRKKITPDKIEMVRTIYTRYFKTKDKNEKSSLAQLKKGFDICDSEVGKLFSIVNLPPLHGKKERHITPQWKKQAIQTAFNTSFPYADIAYFLNLPTHVVQQNMTLMGSRPKTKVFIIQLGREPKTGPKPRLTYRVASQIYEAIDAGFTQAEIPNELTTENRLVNAKIVKYAINHKSEISPPIIQTLKLLYPDKKITKPYTQATQISK